MEAQIRVVMSSIDGARTVRKYSTIAGAQKFAHRAVGETPERGSSYAVSGDGVAKITVTGATLDELFPKTVERPAPKAFRGYRSYEEMQGDPGYDGYDQEAEDAMRGRRREGDLIVCDDPNVPTRDYRCTCTDAQLIHVGCDCHVERGEPAPAVCFSDDWMPF